MSKSQRKAWKHGLKAAFVGGLAGSLDSSIALMLVAPQEFNLHENLAHTVIVSLTLGILSAIKLSMAYLKQSPLPPDEDTKT